MWKHNALRFALPMFMALGTASIAAPPAPGDCLQTFYQAHAETCLDDILLLLNNDEFPRPASEATRLGFLAGVLETWPEFRSHLQNHDLGVHATEDIFAAFCLAAMANEAGTFAETRHIDRKCPQTQAGTPLLLDKIKPSSSTADNDLLLAAFFGSGDAKYIDAMLDNLRTAKPEDAASAVRMAIMYARFQSGPPKGQGRFKTLLQAICEKYDCGAKTKSYGRLVTMSSAVWALTSLEKHDENITKYVNAYLSKEPMLAAIYKSEAKAAEAYFPLAVFTDLSGDNRFSQSLFDYEHLVPAEHLSWPPNFAPN